MKLEEAQPLLKGDGHPERCISRSALDAMNVQWTSHRPPGVLPPEFRGVPFLPVQLIGERGRIERLEFYDGCQGFTYFPSKEIRDCLTRELSSWRLDPGDGCPKVLYGRSASLEIVPTQEGISGSVTEGSCGA